MLLCFAVSLDQPELDCPLPLEGLVIACTFLLLLAAVYMFVMLLHDDHAAAAAAAACSCVHVCHAAA